MEHLTDTGSCGAFNGDDHESCYSTLSSSDGSPPFAVTVALLVPFLASQGRH